MLEKNNYRIAIIIIFHVSVKLSIITKLPPQFRCRPKICREKSVAIMMTNLLFFHILIWNDIHFSQSYLNDRLVSISLLNEVAYLLFCRLISWDRFILQIYCDDTKNLIFFTDLILCGRLISQSSFLRGD